MIEQNADLKNLPLFLEIARNCAEQLDFEKSSIMQIELALEEVIVNIINYAYPLEKGTIGFSCSGKEGNLVMEIADSGIPFDMMSAEDPDIDASLEDRKVGGLGVFFVKQLMDEVFYERRDGKNILILVKGK